MEYMKNNLKRLLKTGILIFAMAILSISCNKDEENLPTEIHQETKIKEISFSEFSNRVKSGSQLDKLNSLIDSNIITQENTQNRLDSNSTIIILTDEVTAIQEDDFTFYTFKIYTITEGDEFYNLVIKVNNQQEIVGSEFLEYQPSIEWLADSSLPFTGYVKLIQNDFLSIDNLFASRGSGLCATGATGEWECNEGNNHAPGEGTSCTSWTYYISVTYGPCPTTIDAGDSGGGGTSVGSGDSGGGGTGGGTSTKPNKPCVNGDNGFDNSDGNCIDEDDLQIINELEGKALCVYNKLKSSSTGFKNSIKKFDGEFTIADIKFELDNTGETVAVYDEFDNIIGYDRAYTSFPDANNLITISINNVHNSNNNVDTQPNLLLAQTIAHEVIHAEMFRQILDAVENGSIIGLNNQDVLDALASSEYTELYEYFRQYQNWSHTYMAEQFRDVIARITQEFDTGIPVAENQQPMQLYLDLAWRGLMNNVAWDNEGQNQTAIENTINNYVTNNSNETCID
jgi:hypothetical protein